jgi:hypothetical protein
MWVVAGDRRAPGHVRYVGRRRLSCRLTGGYGLFRLRRLRQHPFLVTLRQNLDGKVGAVTLAQAAPDAVGGLDDRVVSKEKAVLRADLDADIAALAPFVDPADVDVIDDRGGEVRAPFGGVWRGRG